MPFPLFSVQPHHVWLTLNGTLGRWDNGTNGVPLPSNLAIYDF